MTEDIIIKVEDAGVQMFLQKLKAKYGNLKPIMSEIGELMLSSISENFIQHGRYSVAGSIKGGGQKWKSLSPLTIKMKRKTRNPENILLDTGRLAASFQYKTTKDSVRIGTNVVYAAIQNFGGVVTIPAHKRDVKFKATKSGTFQKQKSNKNLLVFAGKKTKKTNTKNVSFSERKFTIPARPFMVVQDADLNNIINAMAAYFVNVS